MLQDHADEVELLPLRARHVGVAEEAWAWAGPGRERPGPGQDIADEVPVMGHEQTDIDEDVVRAGEVGRQDRRFGRRHVGLRGDLLPVLQEPPAAVAGEGKVENVLHHAKRRRAFEDLRAAPELSAPH